MTIIMKVMLALHVLVVKGRVMMLNLMMVPMPVVVMGILIVMVITEAQ